MNVRHILSLGLLAATVCALAACGAVTPTSGRLQPAATTAAPGTHRELCPVTTDHGQVNLALDLPTSFVRGKDCSWSRPVVLTADEDSEWGDERSGTATVSVFPVARHDVLAKEYRDERPLAVEGDVPQGDDSILHLDLSRNVAAIGLARGDRLSYFCFCDGQDRYYRAALADGVQILLTGDVPSSDSDSPSRREVERQFDVAVNTAGFVR